MDEKYGSAPIIFLDEEKRKEWESLDSDVKRDIYKMLHTCASKMEVKILIEMLCNVIIDMDQRIQILEKRCEVDPNV